MSLLKCCYFIWRVAIYDKNRIVSFDLLHFIINRLWVVISLELLHIMTTLLWLHESSLLFAISFIFNLSFISVTIICHLIYCNASTSSVTDFPVRVFHKELPCADVARSGAWAPRGCCNRKACVHLVTWAIPSELIQNCYFVWFVALYD